MNSSSWTAAGCRPREPWGETGSQLLFHNCEGKPGNLASKRTGPFSPPDLSMLDNTGAIGTRSTGLLKVKVEDGWLCFDVEGPTNLQMC